MESDAKQIDALSVDWELANNAATDWARQYSAELVRGITNTTRDRIRSEVAYYTQNQQTIGQLGKRLEGVFSPQRANMIAVTEVTRSYSEGNQTAWKESGVVEGKEWNTNNDELVCPICGPLDGQVVRIGDTFEGGFDGPPAHPRCRCWVSPVVIDDVGLEGAAGPDLAELEFIQRLENEADNFTGIRPPAGRAPRGMGEEYRQRRRIVSRIETQIKWQNTAERQLRQYRGQVGVRQQWKIDVAKERVRQLDKGITKMLEIASDAEIGDWGFKTDIIDGVIEYLSAYREMAV